jgi:uncharacterized membrane protein (UPF0127 family)
VAKSGKNNKRLIIAIVLIVALALFLLRPVLFESRKIIPKKSPNAITMEPQFTKEGRLVFRNAENDTLKVVDIEIADDDQERTQGMMYRTNMSFDRAMLFIMEYEREQSFWMRNTKMSLDILYVNGDLEIVTIYKHTQPYSESPIPSFKKAKYVVETAAGFCEKYNIQEGDFIEFTRIE